MRYNNAFLVLKEANDFVIVPLVRREGVENAELAWASTNKVGQQIRRPERVVMIALCSITLGGRSCLGGTGASGVCAASFGTGVSEFSSIGSSISHGTKNRCNGPSASGSSIPLKVEVEVGSTSTIFFLASRMVCGLALPCHKYLNFESRWQVLKSSSYM